MKITIFLAIGLLCFFEELVAQSVEENLVTIGTKFKKFCLDNEGNKYKKNEKLYGACEEYTCVKSKKNVIWKATDLKTCCYEYGLWYPMYNNVYAEEYGPSLAMNYICDWELKVTPSMDIKGCSIRGRNVEPGQYVLWPEKCAGISCYNDENNFPTMDYYPHYFDGTGCCEFDGSLLGDGHHGITPDGLSVQCCKGMLNYVFPYINGTEPEFPGGEGTGTGGGGETGGTGPGQGSDTCTCGQRYGSTKIVGGQETDINEYPWQVGIVSGSWGTSVWCGATLISDQWIMTAAHCTIGQVAEDIEVLVGEHNYKTDAEKTALRMVISEIRQHEDYDSSTTDFNFSLLKLETPIDFTAYPHIRPACLPENDDNDYTGYPAIVSGWGTTSSGGAVSSYLQYVEVNVLSNPDCSNSYGSSITEQMLCANVEGGGKYACQGDTGGPLVSRNPDLYELIGVVSWRVDVGCTETEYPGVYARMSKQLAWVADQTAGTWNTCGRV